MRPSSPLKFLVIALISIPAVSTLNAQTDATEAIGEVHFQTSCVPAVTETFDAAVAMLHSFEFDESRLIFERIAADAADCAMAYWGIAMTYYHPLWAPPSAGDLARGAAAVTQARALADRATPRERLYIEAIGGFFDLEDGTPHRERARRYEQAMARLLQDFPTDREARIFHDLARLSIADPTDKTYAVQNRVGPELEALFVEWPEHPGLAHYIIHSYDYPELADRAVHAADRYLDIARALPHALHMSGHIYTLLGMWERAIEGNRLSVDAALRRAEMYGLGEGTQNELHSQDYLVYAYLQRGEDDEALAVVERVAAYDDLSLGNGVVIYNSSAIPVRYAMERKDWELAAQIPLLDEAKDWVRNDQTMNAQALRYWARIVGAAKTGKMEQAESELTELERIAAELADQERVWGRNTSQVFRLQAASWLALEKGEHAKAEELMHAAARLEDQTDKSSISPGRVLPAHEQLGDLLSILGRPEESLAAYEESLRHAPGRINSIRGAAQAAEAAGDADLARDYHQLLARLEN